METLKDQLIDRINGVSNEISLSNVHKKAIMSVQDRGKKVKASEQKERIVNINDNIDSLAQIDSYICKS
jgi:hypothetical protein